MLVDFQPYSRVLRVLHDSLGGNALKLLFAFRLTERGAFLWLLILMYRMRSGSRSCVCHHKAMARILGSNATAGHQHVCWHPV